MASNRPFWIRPHSKIQRVLPVTEVLNHIRFHGSFWLFSHVTISTNRQTNKQTNGGDNVKLAGEGNNLATNDSSL